MVWLDMLFNQKHVQFHLFVSIKIELFKISIADLSFHLFQNATSQSIPL